MPPSASGPALPAWNACPALRPQPSLAIFHRIPVARAGCDDRRVGRFLQGIIVFWWGLAGLPGIIEAWDIPLLIVSFASGVAVFLSIFIAQGALTFVTTESLEIVNALTYGGVRVTQYPLSGYRRFLSMFFVFGIPLGAVTYLPVCAVMGKESFPGWPAWTGFMSPLLALPFIALAYCAWRAGVRRHTGAGG